MEIISLPTGKLIIDDYGNGKLETLSIGDYGKSKNVHALFLGHYKHINGVRNGNCLPLQEKWVMTLSTQYGCPMKCVFCDAHNVVFKGNASFNDLFVQFENARNCFPFVKYTDRLNIHFARMGEPAFNYKNIFQFCTEILNDKRYIQNVFNLRVETIHPVFTTSIPKMPKSKIADILYSWASIKNDIFRGQAGLQLSINTTNEEIRNRLFANRSMSLQEISNAIKKLPPPIGRKYCLNIAYASGTEVEGKVLARYFNPDDWMVKITPIHNNNACKEFGLETAKGYTSYEAYSEPEDSCLEAGFDTLVFVPSMDEENSTITCGNAILGGSTIKLEK